MCGSSSRAHAKSARRRASRKSASLSSSATAATSAPRWRLNVASLRGTARRRPDTSPRELAIASVQVVTVIIASLCLPNVSPRELAIASVQVVTVQHYGLIAADSAGAREVGESLHTYGSQGASGTVPSARASHTSVKCMKPVASSSSVSDAGARCRPPSVRESGRPLRGASSSSVHPVNLENGLDGARNTLPQPPRQHRVAKSHRFGQVAEKADVVPVKNGGRHYPPWVVVAARET